jgi:hypothetical protein
MIGELLLMMFERWAGVRWNDVQDGLVFETGCWAMC